MNFCWDKRQLEIFGMIIWKIYDIQYYTYYESVRVDMFSNKFIMKQNEIHESVGRVASWATQKSPLPMKYLGGSSHLVSG